MVSKMELEITPSADPHVEAIRMSKLFVGLLAPKYLWVYRVQEPPQLNPWEHVSPLSITEGDVGKLRLLPRSVHSINPLVLDKRWTDYIFYYSVHINN